MKAILQQLICNKGWLNHFSLQGTSTNAIYDSNNIASVTDVATGKQTPNFTNNFNSANNYATTDLVKKIQVVVEELFVE